MGAGQKSDAFSGHQVDAALNNGFSQLEFGNSQNEQSADVAGALYDCHPVSGAVQLLGGGQARRARADYGNFFPGSVGWRLRLDPTVLEPPVNNLFLDVLDGDRVRVDAQDATGLARRGTDAAGEFGEIVGGQQCP